MSLSKYRNKMVMVDGIRFDSMAEAYRYRELVLLEKAATISELETQVPFDVQINGSRICKYYADFSYVVNDGRVVAEDVKGVETALFKLKWKLVKALYPDVEFRLIKAKRSAWRSVCSC